MNKEEILREFDKKFVYTELEDSPDSIIDGLEVIEHLNDDIFPFEIKQFISNLIDTMEAEKKEALDEERKNAVSGVFKDIADLYCKKWINVVAVGNLSKLKAKYLNYKER